MKTASLVNMIYGILTIAGGMVSYLKTESELQFAVSLVFGFVLIWCSFSTGKGSFTGVYVGLFVALGLGVFFGLRYTKLGLIMPNGIMAIISMFALGFSVYALSNKEQLTSENNTEKSSSKNENDENRADN